MLNIKPIKRNPVMDNKEFNELLGKPTTEPVEEKEKKEEKKSVEVEEKKETVPKPERANEENRQEQEEEREEDIDIDLSQSFGDKQKKVYLCEQKKRIVLPALDTVVNTKPSEFRKEALYTMSVPNSIVEELKKIADNALEPIYVRNIFVNCVKLFLQAYQKDIESFMERKQDANNK